MCACVGMHLPWCMRGGKGTRGQRNTCDFRFSPTMCLPEITPGLKTWQQEPPTHCWMNSLSVLFVLFLLTQVVTCGVVVNCLELTMYTWLT